jgi:hypothetical protein
MWLYSNFSPLHRLQVRWEVVIKIGFREWTAGMWSEFKWLSVGSNFHIDPSSFAFQGTHCHMPCALRLLGFELHPVHECMLSPRDVFEIHAHPSPFWVFVMFYSYLVWHLPTCRGLFLHLIILTDTHTHTRARARTHTLHSVELFWTSNQPVAKTSTWQHTTHMRERHPRPRWDSNPQSHQASCRIPTL